MKEIRENRNKWKNILYLWIGRLNVIKMFILPKANYKFNATCIKIPVIFFFLNRSRRNTTKIHAEPQMIQTSQSDLEKKEQCWRHNTS